MRFWMGNARSVLNKADAFDSFISGRAKQIWDVSLRPNCMIPSACLAQLLSSGYLGIHQLRAEWRGGGEAAIFSFNLQCTVWLTMEMSFSIVAIANEPAAVPTICFSCCSASVRLGILHLNSLSSRWSSYIGGLQPMDRCHIGWLAPVFLQVTASGFCPQYQ